MDKQKKGQYVGMVGALIVHILIFALLILITIVVSLPEEDDGGVPVMMGDTDFAKGNDDPSLVEVDILSAPPPVDTHVPQPQETVDQELITQTEEESIVIKPTVTPKKEKPKEVKKPEAVKKPVVKKPDVVKKPEKTAAEKAAEAAKLAEAQAEQARKAAEEATRNRVSNAFGKGTQMGGNKGTSNSGTGVEGSRDGNSSTGAKTGVGGYGTFNLGGRSIGEGGLPRPVYNVQEEGTVVVSITVNPAGRVISTSINLQATKTMNASLRKAAQDAAKKARFNSVDGVNNQTGTITYFFNLR